MVDIITYTVVIKGNVFDKNNHIDLVSVEVDGYKLLKYDILNKAISILPRDTKIFPRNRNQSILPIENIGHLLDFIEPPKFVPTYRVFYTDSNNIQSPDNWDLIGGVEDMKEVEALIRDNARDKSEYERKETHYPVILSYQVK